MPFYFDDGTEFNPALYPKPDLCIACAVNDHPQEEDDMLCTFHRGAGKTFSKTIFSLSLLFQIPTL